MMLEISRPFFWGTEGRELLVSDERGIGDVATKAHLRAEQAGLKKLKLPAVAAIEDQLAIDVIEHEGSLRLVRAGQGLHQASAFEHYGVGFQVQMLKGLSVEAKLGGLKEQVRAIEGVGAL